MCSTATERRDQSFTIESETRVTCPLPIALIISSNSALFSNVMVGIESDQEIYHLLDDVVDTVGKVLGGAGKFVAGLSSVLHTTISHRTGV